MAQQPLRNDYGYRAYSELSHFVFVCSKNQGQRVFACCREVGELHAPKPLVFTAIEEEHFLVGTRVHAALENITSQYLKTVFRGSACRLFEEFTSTVLSTVAARSVLGQGVSCFCPEIIIGGDDHSAFFLFGQLLDGLISCSWEKGSTIGACKAEFQPFVTDQRQLECHASRRHSDISNVVSYLTQQSGFRSCRHLYRVSLVGFQVGWVAVIKH